MKPADHIEAFLRKYNYKSGNAASKPNYIHCKWIGPEEAFYGCFDFKNDNARKAFGALCHVLYTSAESWEITTYRA